MPGILKYAFAALVCFSASGAVAAEIVANALPQSLIRVATDSLTPKETMTITNPTRAVLASQFMGQSVYSTADERVGDINDLVMDKELENIVAIIGVGGFLGMGEKDVAIPVKDIQAVKDSDNNLRLTITATKEQLRDAAAFDRSDLK